MIEIYNTDRPVGREATLTWGIGGNHMGTAALGRPAEHSSAAKELFSA